MRKRAGGLGLYCRVRVVRIYWLASGGFWCVKGPGA